MRSSFGLGVLLMGAALLGGCTYNQLKPEAASVVATATRPGGNCKSLGTLTGKGGGGGGAWVSNEELVKYAVNDLRNQAAALGATHVLTSGTSLGGTEGTTTSAMVMGEALKCEAGTEPEALRRVQGVTPSTPTASAKEAEGGCQFDTQCKGDRVCVAHQCVTEPVAPTAGTSSASPAASATAPAASAP